MQSKLTLLEIVSSTNCFECCFINTENDASDHVSLALYCADYGRFQPVITTASCAAFLVPMSVAVFAADIGFIDLNDAAELVNVLNQSGANLVAHQPRGLVAPKSHVAHDLQCAHSLFARKHQVNDFEPLPQRACSCSQRLCP